MTQMYQLLFFSFLEKIELDGCLSVMIFWDGFDLELPLKKKCICVKIFIFLILKRKKIDFSQK